MVFPPDWSAGFIRQRIKPWVRLPVETGVPVVCQSAPMARNFSQTFLRWQRTPTKHNPNICGVMDNF
jgi:hypothetical protein